MARPSGSGRQRLLALVLVCGAIFIDAGTAVAKTAPIDRDRAQASLTLASHYWVQAGLDKLPQRYERARFEKAVDDKDLGGNSGREYEQKIDHDSAVYDLPQRQCMRGCSGWLRRWLPAVLDVANDALR